MEVQQKHFYYRLKCELNLKTDSDMLFYFYWYDYKCFGLTMHKKQYPHIKIIARTHGYELYDEREVYGRQFFKEQNGSGTGSADFCSSLCKNIICIVIICRMVRNIHYTGWVSRQQE